MEIEKRGIPPNEIDFRGTCDACKSVLKAKRRELKMTEDRNMDFYTGTCPVCKHLVYFELIK
jgi:RNase P subunit RPR2